MEINIVCVHECEYAPWTARTGQEVSRSHSTEDLEALGCREAVGPALPLCLCPALSLSSLLWFDALQFLPLSETHKGTNYNINNVKLKSLYIILSKL